VMVELNQTFEEGEPAPAPPAPAESAVAATASAALPPPLAITPAGDAADAVRLTAEALKSAPNVRWPMYLRNFKQVLRAAAIDERRYGLSGLMDLLRACQREGLIRTERDRRGGLRVFQGPALAAPFQPPPAPMPDVQAAEEPTSAPIDEPQPLAPIDEELDADPIDAEPSTIIDTTAELLGRSKPKRARAKPAPASRRAAPKKPAAARRTSRARKPADSRDDTA
jgi:hypothetical protein